MLHLMEKVAQGARVFETATALGRWPPAAPFHCARRHKDRPTVLHVVAATGLTACRLHSVPLRRVQGFALLSWAGKGVPGVPRGHPGTSLASCPGQVAVCGGKPLESTKSAVPAMLPSGARRFSQGGACFPR